MWRQVCNSTDINDYKFCSKSRKRRQIIVRPNVVSAYLSILPMQSTNWQRDIWAVLFWLIMLHQVASDLIKLLLYHIQVYNSHRCVWRTVTSSCLHSPYFPVSSDVFKQNPTLYVIAEILLHLKDNSNGSFSRNYGLAAEFNQLFGRLLHKLMMTA